MAYMKRVITGDKFVNVFTRDGSIWLSINDHSGLKIANTSCSEESAVAIATMILNAVQSFKQ